MGLLIFFDDLSPVLNPVIRLCSIVLTVIASVLRPAFNCVLPVSLLAFFSVHSVHDYFYYIKVASSKELL